MNRSLAFSATAAGITGATWSGCSGKAAASVVTSTARKGPHGTSAENRQRRRVGEPQGPEDALKSALLKRVWQRRRLDAAWRSVRANSLSSQSDEVRKGIAQFEEDSSGRIGSLQHKLSRGHFEFSPARGVAIPKPGKNDVRPIVIARVEDRIVQRALLDVLQDIEVLRSHFRNPYSFGGIKRGQDDELAAVPAAIAAVLQAIGAGARFAMCADISAFFTRIPKPRVIEIVGEAVADDEFTAFLQAAIHVELSNLAKLRQHADRFPTGEIGVAQGSSLSPFLGNIVLADFDRRMNAGDCRCIRYIDDFIILAPTAKAAAARLSIARDMLGNLGMQCAPGKTSPKPIPIDNRIEFLGIELHNGLIRPASGARARFLGKVRVAFDEGRKALTNYRNGQPLAKANALLGTLKRVDGIVQGWGKHYKFCNDVRCFENLDAELGVLIREYLGLYRDERNAAPEARRPAMLGIEMLGTIKRAPLTRPQISSRRSTRRAGAGLTL